jgi:predicted HicB family RNase H-like nuclease
MEKKVSIRLDEGVHMLIEANAKKNYQTVSDWIRHAVDEQIKRTINSRALDRIEGV